MSRRIVLYALITLALAAVPAVALAAGVLHDDGTLVVKKASGTVTLSAQGTFFARVNGTVRIRDLDVTDDSSPQFGRGSCVGRVKDVSDQTGDPVGSVLFCRGKDVRVLMQNGSFKLKINGTGLSLSAVGQGRGVLEGDDTTVGTYSLNDGPDKPLPLLPTSFLLQANKPSGE